MIPKFQVCEKFVSINGEGRRAGELAVFIRFKGCNLSCSYCDTAWANTCEAAAVTMSVCEICSYIKETGIKNVTLTGGEPLFRPGMQELLAALKKLGSDVEIETNGAVDLSPYCSDSVRPQCFTMDYKLPSSGMENKMLLSNLALLNECDCVKFVAGSEGDLCRALEIIRRYKLDKACSVYISPVFGSIKPDRIVDFMKDNVLNGIKLQIQLHKVIWDPNKRGV